MDNLPEPKFLNIEYFFNKFFALLGYIYNLVLKFFVLIKKIDFQIIFIFIIIIIVSGIIFVSYKVLSMKRRKSIMWSNFFVKDLPASRVTRWDIVKRKMDSENSADWKMAIIEADSIIDEIMERIGYGGESLGERLKGIEPSDFDNLQNIWEAHKVRNRIAHDGDKFELTKEMANGAIEKYEKALKELKYI